MLYTPLGGYRNADLLPLLGSIDYLADSVDAFLTDSGYDFSELDNPFEGPPEIHLGLTFSFPVEQTALDSGTLLTWTKGFAAKNAIGKDIVRLLQDAFDRKHLHVRCVALVNDVSEPCLCPAGGVCSDCL